MTTKIWDLKDDRSEMYVVEGSVKRLCVWSGRLNVLCFGQGACFRCQRHQTRGKPVTSYDDRCVEDFNFYLNDLLIIGAFRRVDFSEGEELKVVVSEYDEHSAWANAVVRPSDGLLWMPYATSMGRYAIATWTSKFMSIILLLCWIFINIFSLFKPLSSSILETAAISFFALLSVLFLVGFLGYRSSVPDGLYAEDIMKQLGFKNPKIVSLERFAVDRAAGVYDLRKALKAYGSLSKYVSPVGNKP